MADRLVDPLHTLFGASFQEVIPPALTFYTASSFESSFSYKNDIVHYVRLIFYVL
jgi:hypothetical protein